MLSNHTLPRKKNSVSALHYRVEEIAGGEGQRGQGQKSHIKKWASEKTSQLVKAQE